MTELSVSTAGIVFRPDPAGMNQLLRSESGTVVRHLLVLGDRVQSNARNRVGVSKPDPVPRRKPHMPGTLRASIVKRLAYRGSNPVVLVGVFGGEAATYAAFVHEGTVPHQITARRAPRLVFYWSRTGRVMYVRTVQHPGTRPQRFLTEALADEIRR